MVWSGLNTFIPRFVESHSGARGNIRVGPKHFHGAPLGKNVNFFSKWYILAYFIFLADGGAPKRRGARGSLPRLPHPLDGPVYSTVADGRSTQNFLADC